jgi:hypothetical protein
MKHVLISIWEAHFKKHYLVEDDAASDYTDQEAVNWLSGNSIESPPATCTGTSWDGIGDTLWEACSLTHDEVQHAFADYLHHPAGAAYGWSIASFAEFVA